MYRDFTEQAKEQLKGYIDDVTPRGFFETLGDRITDFFRNFVETDITNYAGNFQGYQKRILDVKNVGKRNIDKLFDKEWGIEDSYKNWLSGACDTYDDELIKSFRALSNMLDAKGAGFHFSRQNLDDFKNASEAVSESSAEIATAKEEIETKEKEIEKLKSTTSLVQIQSTLLPETLSMRRRISDQREKWRCHSVVFIMLRIRLWGCWGRDIAIIMRLHCKKKKTKWKSSWMMEKSAFL